MIKFDQAMDAADYPCIHQRTEETVSRPPMAVIDKKTGRVLRGGWHHEVGVCRPGQNLREIKASLNAASQLTFDAEREERKAQLKFTIGIAQEQLAGNIPPHQRQILEQILTSAEQELTRW